MLAQKSALIAHSDVFEAQFEGGYLENNGVVQVRRLVKKIPLHPGYIKENTIRVQNIFGIPVASIPFFFPRQEGRQVLLIEKYTIFCTKNVPSRVEYNSVENKTK